jgi:mycobactin lysine-N-oxygenase
MPKSICVIGGGPKAAALAAKLYALAECERKYTIPEVTIAEADAVAAAWRGGGRGFTDGLQPICTLAERDVGYPYSSSPFGEEAMKLLYKEFSWSAFCLDPNNRNADYNDWVARGRHLPPHHLYASYIDWVITKCVAAKVVTLEYWRMKKIRRVHGATKWEVVFERKDDTSGATIPRDFDAVVVTGSPEPLRFDSVRNIPDILDGKTFWQKTPEELRRMLEKADDPSSSPSILIIGAGGTAASVAARLLGFGLRHIPIRIVGRPATLYTRSPGYFEDRLFSDPVAWETIATEARSTFVRRLTRGVVWSDVIQQLSRARNVEYISADVQDVVHLSPPGAPAGTPPEWYGSSPTSKIPYHPATLIIDARGFNSWWFAADIEPPSLRTAVEALRPPPTAQIKLVTSLTGSLAIAQTGIPDGLHVPMHASYVGPGADNLMALGWMADAILRDYIPTHQIP